MMFAACGTAEEAPPTEDPVEENPEQTETDTSTPNNDANDDAGNGDTNQDTSPDSNQEEMQNKMDELNYTDFELDVDYEDNQSYEAELETRNQDQTIDAEIEDDLNGVNLKGREAFNELYPLVEQLTIDQNTSKEDTIDEILNVFGLSTDYQKFELEITFKDGPTMEYEDKK